MKINTPGASSGGRLDPVQAAEFLGSRRGASVREAEGQRPVGAALCLFEFQVRTDFSDF